MNSNLSPYDGIKWTPSAGNDGMLQTTANPSGGEPCCGGPSLPRSQKRPDMSLPFVVGESEQRGRKVPLVGTTLRWEDHLGSLKARFGVGRMDYSIPPGLYGVGQPHGQSPVFVTANYKMSFDRLREQLDGMNAWILVLDTRGINVWCAAGKGTFGTEELLSKMEECELKNLVDHRKIIVPQLGAPGVAGYTIKAQSGFRVVFGPVEARDIPLFLQKGNKVSPGMRRKRFPLRERFALIPIELIEAFKIIGPLSVLFFVLSGLVSAGEFTQNLKGSGIFAVQSLFGALIAGTILFPLLLPILPGRSFSVKSVPLGLLISALVIPWQGGVFESLPVALEAVSWVAIILALTSFMAMNFTGSSTYTSLSGVKREMGFALPAQIVFVSVGILLWIGSRIATYYV